MPQEYWQRFKDKPLALTAPDTVKEDLDETRCVLAMMENLDWNVGRVLAQLKKLGIEENTLVVYFSDNGPNTFRWNGAMKGKKGGTDEGGVRSVCYLRWPGTLPKGRVVEEISGAIDLLPTLGALTGAPRVGDQPLDGRDLTPLLKEENPNWAPRLIFSHQNGNVSVRSQQYRLDAQGALYDMLADPGQQTDVSDTQPAVANELRQAMQQWRTDVLGSAAAPSAGGPKKKGQAKGAGMDPRPCPVGYAEFPRTPLPARDGVPHGGVKRSANAPNCSYFVNWTTLEDKMTWDVEVHTTGEYEVEILYTCPEGDAGATIEFTHQQSRLTGKVTTAWDPPLYTNQDTIPRPPAESRMKEFRPLTLGTFRLEKGRGPLTLRALEIPGKSVMDVRQVNLTLKKNR